MPVEALKCVNCVKMDVEDGYLPKEFIEYDFAEDALDFEETKMCRPTKRNVHRYRATDIKLGGHRLVSEVPYSKDLWLTLKILVKTSVMNPKHKITEIVEEFPSIICQELLSKAIFKLP